MFDHAASLAYVRSPLAIRARAENILSAGLDDKLTHFAVRPEALDGTAALVADVTRARYPSLDVPVHGRLGHFRAGGVDRVAELMRSLGDDPMGRARALIDLVVVSVLLDAGAGDTWRFTDGQAPGSPKIGRSEGLAVASLRAFAAGHFANESGSPRVDAARLVSLTPDDIARILQVSEANPMFGFAGRAALLPRVGRALLARPDLFPNGRPGGLLDVVRASGRVQLPDVFRHLLDGLAHVWPNRLSLDGAPLGDVWMHPFAGGSGMTAHMMPFHKLTQWLTYSLVEPMQLAGLEVEQVGALTGLPEYRNGGLLVDTGVLVPKHAGVLAGRHRAGDELIIEWRALTVALLDRLADRVRARLGRSAAQMPLAAVLEGGTWAAGRQLATARRPGGGSPIAIELDGTVF